MRTATRAAGIVIKENKILLIHRLNQGKEYYVFPGGGVEEKETAEKAVLREIKEETSITIAVPKLLYHLHIIGDINNSDQYFYLCNYVSGTPELRSGSIEYERTKDGNDTYEPVWLDSKALSEITLYPLEIRDWLIKDLKVAFTNGSRKKTYKRSELRQN